MYYTVYILEDQADRSWYIGMSSRLKGRMIQHLTKQVVSTRNKKNLKLIYAELYLDKKDAAGRERFLKSGAGRRYIKKQLKYYLS